MSGGVIPPGATIGILGGGQLGRMLAIAAAQLGYGVHVYAPEAGGPAFDVATCWTQAAYDDPQALARFADAVDVATYEFENVPVAALGAITARVALHPPARALEIAQDRVAEKRFAAALGVAVADWRPVDDRAGLDAAIGAVGAPAILKTRRFGYDGKGQARIAASADAGAAWEAIGGQPAILERRVDFVAEFSILGCRGADGGWSAWPAVTNVHRDGILRTSAVPPAGVVAAQAGAAAESTRRIADALGHVGVLAVEYFATDAGPLFNEMAPRVHNSGHWTIEGAVASQFENHVRAICGLPLGSTGLAAPRVAMENLIGADVARWPTILAEPGAHLHLYGKHDARPGRKMGHVTRLSGMDI